MDQLIIAFVTGLTTGGLSCLAVQGGLLASSIARQVEQDLVNHSSLALPRTGKGNPKTTAQRQTALPIALFLSAKLLAYTLLGALLGLLGSFLTLSPTSRAILMMAIGVFMIGNGLRMLNIHPIFRYFTIEPPKFITRYIRRTARNGTELLTPLFLGALTVLIPCGVTQAMMAVALAAGSPASGAALMFAFTLGTSPVFFIVAYLATQLGARLEKYFMRFVAIVVLILGFISLNNGLNLVGSPLSFNSLISPEYPGSTQVSNQPVQTPGQAGGLRLDVKNNGYSPRLLHAVANQPLTLSLVTNRTFSCARDFVIPALKYYQLLPDTGNVSVKIPPQAPGTVMKFTCSMGMYTGQIVFDR